MLINLKIEKMKYIYLILLVVAGVTSSCIGEVTTANVSRQTDFPVITLNGEAQEIILQGEPYVEQGAVATEGGEEIPVETSYSPGQLYGSPGVDTDVPDVYSVAYSATNTDGFSGAGLRTVIVVPPTGDLVTSIEGIYTADAQRAPSFTPGPPYENMEYIFISRIEGTDNQYALSHGIGGYYAIGRGYGPNYIARYTEITANSIPGNDFSFTGALIEGFGLPIQVSDMIVNPETKTITFTGAGDFANGTFKVQLTQLQF